jgi:hypothetical protein
MMFHVSWYMCCYRRGAGRSFRSFRGTDALHKGPAGQHRARSNGFPAILTSFPAHPGIYGHPSWYKDRKKRHNPSAGRRLRFWEGQSHFCRLPTAARRRDTS